MVDATPRWGGGDVNVPCNLLTLLMLRHAAVGGDVNVPCNLLTLLMLRHVMPLFSIFLGFFLKVISFCMRMCRCRCGAQNAVELGGKVMGYLWRNMCLKVNVILKQVTILVGRPDMFC